MALLIGIERPAVRELYEARRVLEIGIVALAAQNRTQEQLGRLDSATGELVKFKDDPKARIYPNVQFHSILAEMSGNVILERLMGSLMTQIADAIELTNSATENSEDTIAVHQEIADAIKKMNPDLAKLAMNHHMDLAERELDRYEGADIAPSQSSAQHL